MSEFRMRGHHRMPIPFPYSIRRNQTRTTQKKKNPGSGSDVRAEPSHNSGDSAMVKSSLTGAGRRVIIMANFRSE